MSTCLVTGAAGFIGSHLARSLLAEGHAVVGVDNLDPFYDRQAKQANVDSVGGGGAFEFVEIDIRDDGVGALMRRCRPDVIFHLAAHAGVRPSIEDPARYVSVNVDGLRNVLDAARASDTRRFVFASSSSVYGNNRKVPFAETDPVDEPISPYAATKRAGELLCHCYAHLFGLRIASLRLFTVYGPAQRPDLAIARFMRLLAAGESIPMYGDGTSSRDYTFVDDIVDGLCLAARWTEDPSAAFRIFNIGGASPVSLSDLIAAVSEVVGVGARIEQLPPQPGDVDRTFADLSRSEAELQYAPKVTLAEGLELQWRWYSSMLQGSR